MNQKRRTTAPPSSPNLYTGGEDFIRRILDAEPGFVYIFDLRERRFVFSNRELFVQFGYTAQELGDIGEDLLATIIPPRDLPRLAEHFESLRQASDDDYLEFEYTVFAKDGEERVVHSRDAVFARSDDGSVTQIVGVAHDITRYKKIEQDLRASTAQLTPIIEHSTNLFYSHTADHVLTYVSPQSEHFFDCEPDEALRRWTEFATDHPMNRIGFEATQRAIDTGERQPPYELELRTLKNRIIWVEVRESPVVADGKTIAIVGSLSDITDRKNAEKQLKRSEEYYRSLIENASDIVTVLDRKGRFTFTSPSMQRLMGYPPHELLGKNMVNFIHPDDQMKIIRSFAIGMRRQGVTQRDLARFRHADGSWRTFDSIGMSIRNQDGELAGIINSRDISDRVEFERKLQRSEERYRSFFEDDLSGAYISTPDGTILDCNPAFVRMFGFASVEEAKATGTTALYKNPNDRAKLLQFLEKEKKVEYHPMELLRRDGTTLYAVGNITATTDADGHIVRMKGYLFDETKRRQLETELVQAQKMESLGRLAGGIAHDFNNLLAIILGQAGLLARNSDDAERVKKGAETIETASHRGADLIKQLLTFARKTDVSLGSVDLNASVKELIAFIQVTFPKTIEIRSELSDRLSPVSGDPTQLYQVLLNLCVNARDAMPNGGVLTIRTELVPQSDIPKDLRPGTGSYVKVTIHDTGVGMDRQTIERIYEPFFTTKEQGKGTGLGLSVAFGIVESHHGHIDVRSAPDSGTAFHVYFSVADASSLPDEKNSTDPSPLSTGKETILIIEDEEMLRDMLDLALQDQGYKRIIAVDGKEGITLFAEHHDTIDLVVTDMGLPKVNGKQVVREITTIDPLARIIVMSGYLEPGIRSALLSMGVQAILQKPFITDDLLRAVREVLDLKGRVSDGSPS